MTDKGEKMSSILDDAREKIAKELYYIDHLPEIHVWEKSQMQELYLIRADHILAISGTTDIECPECNGKRFSDHRENGPSTPCDRCFGTGKGGEHKWKVSVTLKNGELSPNSRLDFGYYTKEDIDKAGYVQEVKE
ncbi:hypothetical protein LCGC14_1412220 [marine sediment metagenome]|uniref:Uncharacterized protein n=1 Tax=marine sediment metagenome TaxID=412755 RepID=A0A0F9MVP5_9ZZZZ